MPLFVSNVDSNLFNLYFSCNFAKAFEQSLGEELPSDDEEDTEPIDEE